MRILYLDTSSKYLSLAVAEDRKILSKMHRLMDRRHSLQLVPLIDKLLKRAKISLRKIDGFCVGKGPGSFTGLRIGITAIKGLAYVLQKPVVAIPSLDILAQNACSVRKDRDLPLLICTIVDAKQHQVYACLYQGQNGEVKRKSRYLLLPVKELLSRLKGEVLFLGDAISLYHQEICKNRKIKPTFVDEKHWYPRASQALPLAMARFKQGIFDDANSLVPLYLYPKTCQIKKVVGRR